MTGLPPSALSLVGNLSQAELFERLREENEKRIEQDPSCVLLAEQMRDIRGFAAERTRQNIITIGQFRPYLSLFDATEKKDLSPEVLRQRRQLFAEYTAKVINPQEITIIVSEDREWVVGTHDRIIRPLASVDSSDETAALTGSIILNQERKRMESAGRGLDSFGSRFARSNSAENNEEQVKKIYLDSILVAVIQKELNLALAAGKPGIPFAKPFRKPEPGEVVETDTNTGDTTPVASSGEEDTTILL